MYRSAKCNRGSLRDCRFSCDGLLLTNYGRCRAAVASVFLTAWRITIFSARWADLGSTSSSICRCSAIGLSRSSRPNRKFQLSTLVPQRGTTDGYDSQGRGQIRSPDMTRRTSAHLQDFSTFSRMLRLELARWRSESTEMRLRFLFCEDETDRSCTILACQDRAVASRPSR